jgi:hypothetical protein
MNLHRMKRDASCIIPHSADFDKDCSFSLYEYLRTVELWQAGGYHPVEQGTTEDGFAPGK